MNEPRFDFSFAVEGFTSTQGAIVPAEEFFRGTDAQSSVARETIQNSLDARSGDGPVRVVFELREIHTADVPGIGALRAAISAAARDSSQGQGNERLRSADNSANEEKMFVLRIGDYNTSGLTGTESKNDRTSPLSALTRGTGVSSNVGHRGGSFGIGSAVGPMASDISTVLYLSKTKADPTNVFAGYSRLASHEGPDGQWHVGEGFYRNIDRQDDFEYLRDWTPFDPFEKRTEAGTDVFILGYWKAGDRGLHDLRDAVVENFMMALHEEQLIVEGITPHARWVLDKESLGGEIRQSETLRERVLPFYRAVTETDPISGNLKRMGIVRLYINEDSTLEKKLGTWTMRQPLMKVDTFLHMVPHPYAAVLVCEGDQANARLRKLEPPQHNKWDGKRAHGGQADLEELKGWVRERLRDRMALKPGARVKVKGLEKFLPEVDTPISSQGSDVGPPSPSDGSSKDETGSQSGTNEKPKDAKVNTGGRTRVKVLKPAASGSGDPGTGGQKRGGDRPRKSGGGSLSGSADSDRPGNSRVPSGSFEVHAWFDPAASAQMLAIKAQENTEGDIHLAALDSQGKEIDKYELGIVSAEIEKEGSWAKVEHTGNRLLKIALTAGTISRIRITTASRQRLRMGVTDG